MILLSAFGIKGWISSNEDHIEVAGLLVHLSLATWPRITPRFEDKEENSNCRILALSDDLRVSEDVHTWPVYIHEIRLSVAEDLLERLQAEAWRQRIRQAPGSEACGWQTGIGEPPSTFALLAVNR
jgi:hypothetical protein